MAYAFLEVSIRQWVLSILRPLRRLNCLMPRVRVGTVGQRHFTKDLEFLIV